MQAQLDELDLMYIMRGRSFLCCALPRSVWLLVDLWVYFEPFRQQEFTCCIETFFGYSSLERRAWLGVEV